MHIKEMRVVGGNRLEVDGAVIPCVIGKGGVNGNKREGDHATPAGRFALRGCYFRPDRLATPQTDLPIMALTPQDGWCDDPAHPLYNTFVKLPFSGHHETLWREDHCYDLIIPLAYNDDPVTVGKGSAIFLHLMHDDGRATEGCVAISKRDLLKLLPRLSTETMLLVS